MVEREREREGKREKEIDTSKEQREGSTCSTLGGEAWYMGVVCICLSKLPVHSVLMREKRGKGRWVWLLLPPGCVHLSLHLERRVQSRGSERGIIRHGLGWSHVRKNGAGHSAHGKVAILLFLLNDRVDV